MSETGYYIYRAEFDNGQSWSDHSQETIGVFTSPELAMEYCRQDCKSQYEASHVYDDDGSHPAVWSETDWLEGGVNGWTLTSNPPIGNRPAIVVWMHRHLTPDDYGWDRNGHYAIYQERLNPIVTLPTDG